MMFLSAFVAVLLLTSPAIGQDFELTIDITLGETDSTPISTFDLASASNSTSTPTPTIISTPTPTTISTPAPTPTPIATPITIPISVSPETSPASTSPIINTPVISQNFIQTPSPKKKVGPIVGGTIGAVAGVAATTGALALTLTHLPWLWSSLACLLGLFFFRSRRLVVTTDKDVPEFQMGFFITTTPELQILKKSNILWKVHFFGNGQREFVIDIPCWPGHGITRLCYGLISDRETSVEIRGAKDAPAVLEDDTWATSEEPIKVTTIKQLSVTNLGAATSIVLGTTNKAVEAPAPGRIQPFMLIEDFSSQFALETSDLYLHAFKARNNKRDGDYGHTFGIPIAEKPGSSRVIEEDRITPDEGIRINKLNPYTTWSVSSKDNGGLHIKLVPNRKSDWEEFKKENKNKNEWSLGNEEKGLSKWFGRKSFRSGRGDIPYANVSTEDFSTLL